MEIILDGARDVRIKGSAGDTFALIVSINEHLRNQGRLIVSLTVNQEPIASEKLVSQLEAIPIESIEQIEVLSRDIRDLVANHLEQLQETVPELPGLCHELAAVFQGPNPDEGYLPFHQLGEIWNLVKAHEIEIANTLGLDIESWDIPCGGFEHHHRMLNQFLNRAAEAIGAGDCAGLADMLVYEMAPHAEIEATILALFQQHIPKMDNPT